MSITRQRIVNQLERNQDTHDLLVAPGPDTGIQLREPGTDDPVSSESILRTLQLILQETRKTNLLLALLKEPGSINFDLSEPGIGAAQ